VALAPEGTCQPGVNVGFGNAEVGANPFAAPCQKGVAAGGDVDVHHIAFAPEGLAALALLPDDAPAGLVDDIEGHGVDFIGERIGEFHVHVIAELYLVVRVAVAFVVIDQPVA